ncbi:response regulator transcription factor [Thermostichus vulcanus]|uniref:Response regulator n=1 Tax=Thermostichus vulcanus str. 'Rupite' TaxID=2813851 RepID=A0ABT0C6S9_THEVL|nr:response regulator [Thermostichus vulcanus str. 'Rupite']
MSRVLVIEDEPRTRQIFLHCLQLEGFEVFGAENGRLGLEQARTHRPDLIICDIMMPELDGYQVLQTLQQDPTTAWIPVIFLTAKVARQDVRQGMVLGADDYLTKPCTVDEFLTTINARLRKQAFLHHRASLTSAINTADSHSTDSKRDFQYPTHPKLAAVFEYIEAHYAEPIDLTDVARAVGYSPAYLTTLLRKQTGHSVKDWITERRMAEARRLLRHSQASIKHVGQAVGYVDPAYFARHFRQRHGIPPLLWREQQGRFFQA